MSVDPGALARLRVRIEEVLGVDDTAALLDPLAHVEWSKLTTTDDFDWLRADVARHLAEAQAGTERRIAALQGQLRRDLLLVTGGQFFALVAAVAAVLRFG